MLNENIRRNALLKVHPPADDFYPGLPYAVPCHSFNEKELINMNKLRKMVFAGLLSVSVLASVAPTMAKVNEYEGQHRSVASHNVLGDPSQWGIEGDPSQWGFKGDPSQWGIEGDPSQWGISDPFLK
ncbi:MAG: hypothetical protein K8L97_23205 [Anaerolineae bacterium]|nr:hypothetical protein [Anaerolineae bacterium]